MKATKYGWLLAGAIFSVSAVGVLAHGGATGIVKDRMDGMSAMSDAIKVVSDMFRSGQYNPETVKSGAATIKQHAGEELLALFPEGSGGAPSEAKSEVWTDWEAFADLSNDLSVLADVLFQSADNPDGSMPAGGGMMGSGMGTAMMGDTQMPDKDTLAQMPVEGIFNMTVQTCASCHSKYRVEK